MTHLRKKRQHEEQFINCLEFPTESLTGLDCTRRQFDLNIKIDRYILRARELRSQAFTRFTMRALVGLQNSICGGARFVTVFSSRILITLARNHDPQVNYRKVEVLSDRMLKDIGQQRYSFNSESDRDLGGSHLFPVPSIYFATTYTSITPIISD